MSKTKEKKAIVIAEPDVSSNINMNLTHNDVIDVAIQSQLELLEPREQDLRKEIAEVKNALDNQVKILIQKATERAGFSPDTKAFYKALEVLSKASGQKVEPVFDNVHTAHSTNDLVSSPKYFSCAQRNVEDYKQPLAMYRRYLEEKTRTQNIPTRVEFKMYAEIAGVEIKTPEYCKIELSKRDREDHKKNLQALLNRYAALKNEYHKVYLQMLELNYDEKKVKARVVKMSLSKSEKGRNILNLLEQATNTKFLG